MKKARFTQADLTKALKASLSAGLRPSQARITAAGEVLLAFDEPGPKGDDDVDREIARHFRVGA